MDEGDEFEVLAARRRGNTQSLVLAGITVIGTFVVMQVDQKSPLFSGKGSDMAPVLIASFAFIGLMAGLFAIRRTQSFWAGLACVAVLLGGLLLMGR